MTTLTTASDFKSENSFTADVPKHGPFVADHVVIRNAPKALEVIGYMNFTSQNPRSFSVQLVTPIEDGEYSFNSGKLACQYYYQLDEHAPKDTENASAGRYKIETNQTDQGRTITFALQFHTGEIKGDIHFHTV